ncbi:MAG: hypothetical protein J6I69_02205 [Bacilli bacterium]|nr:hypothetical protein [Bacilli bacterium]
MEHKNLLIDRSKLEKVIRDDRYSINTFAKEVLKTSGSNLAKKLHGNTRFTEEEIYKLFCYYKPNLIMVDLSIKK